MATDATPETTGAAAGAIERRQNSSPQQQTMMPQKLDEADGELTSLVAFPDIEEGGTTSRISLPRSSSVSSRSSSSSSLHSETESNDVDGDGYPFTHCEYEEIPSFRWIAPSLRWWKPGKKHESDSGVRGSNGGGRRAMTAGMSTREGLNIFSAFAAFELFDQMEEVMTEERMLFESRDIFGCSAYRATLRGGHQAIFRWLEWPTKPVEDLKCQADDLGRIQHPNLLAISARFRSLGTGQGLFLMYERLPLATTLSARLHAVRGSQPPLDWSTRMDIALGVTRGLHHLHTEVNMVHGSLTSGCILLDQDYNPKIAGHGLSKALLDTRGTDGRSAHSAPELSGGSRAKAASKMSDVYSLGAVIVELSTGIPPSYEFLERIQRDNPTYLDTRKLALECLQFCDSQRPTVADVLRRLEMIKSESVRRQYLGATTAVKQRKKSNVDEGEGAAGATAIISPDIEERIPHPSEDSDDDSTEVSSGSVLELLTSVVAEGAPSEDSCVGKDREGLSESEDMNGLRQEGETTSTASTFTEESTARDPSGERETPDSTYEDPLFSSSPIARVNEDGETLTTISVEENQATVEDKSGSTSADEVDPKPGRTTFMAQPSQLPPVDWAKAADIEDQIKVTTSLPLFTSEPDVTYQRFFRALHDLAHRLPLPSADVLEVQLNKMSMGLHSLGYPIDTWLRAANLLLLSARKRERLERHVEACRASLETRLQDAASELDPVMEELARAESSVAVLRREKEERDEAIAQLEDQLALLKAQREETVGSLAEETDVFAAAEQKTKALLERKEHLEEQYSMLPEYIQSVMALELPPLEEVFDSSFQEILTRVF